MLNALASPPIQQPIMVDGRLSLQWSTWFTQLYKLVNIQGVIPVSPAGVTPIGQLGQLYLTSTGVLASYNGTSWVKYDGSPVVF